MVSWSNYCSRSPRFHPANNLCQRAELSLVELIESCSARHAKPFRYRGTICGRVVLSLGNLPPAASLRRPATARKSPRRSGRGHPRRSARRATPPWSRRQATARLRAGRFAPATSAGPCSQVRCHAHRATAKSQLSRPARTSPSVSASSCRAFVGLPQVPFPGRDRAAFLAT